MQKKKFGYFEFQNVFKIIFFLILNDRYIEYISKDSKSNSSVASEEIEKIAEKEKVEATDEDDRDIELEKKLEAELKHIVFTPVTFILKSKIHS